MSKDTGSVASSGHSWLRLYAAVAAMPLALVACGGGGGGSPSAPTPPPPAPAPTPVAAVVVTPSATSTTPGGAAITLTAVVTNSTATPTWTLSGPGSLNTTSGLSVIYTPPQAGSLDANSTAIVSTALTGATTQTTSLTLTVSATTAGLNWTNVSVASSIGNLLGVDYADGHYVAVSDQGSALASTDAATWSPITLLSSNVSTDHLKAYTITHFGNTYVAAGATSSAPYTSSTGAVATSADGTTWTMGTLPAGATPIHALIAGTRLVGLGETGHLYASTNGSTWSVLTTINGPQTLNSGVYGNGKYVGVGDAGWIILSSDSIAWQGGQVISINGAPVNLHGIAWTGTQFVAVGDSGAISTSTNGTTWSALHPSALAGSLRSVSVSASGLIVVVGDAGIETSTDGVTWTARNDSGAAALSGATFGNGQFVAVGAASTIKASAGN